MSELAGPSIILMMHAVVPQVPELGGRRDEAAILVLRPMMSLRTWSLPSILRACQNATGVRLMSWRAL